MFMKYRQQEPIFLVFLAYFNTSGRKIQINTVIFLTKAIFTQHPARKSNIYRLMAFASRWAYT